MVLPALTHALVPLAFGAHLADWADVSTILAAGGTLAAAWAAFRAIGETRQFNAERAQPYVVVSLEPVEQLPEVVELVVQNLGQTAATDVNLEFNPEPSTSRKTAEGEVISLRYPAKFSVLVPGQRWSTSWDSSAQYNKAGLPREFDVAVTYSGIGGKRQPTLHYVLDWGMYMDRGYMDVKTTADVVGAIGKVAKAVKERSVVD